MTGALGHHTLMKWLLLVTFALRNGLTGLLGALLKAAVLTALVTAAATRGILLIPA